MAPAAVKRMVEKAAQRKEWERGAKLRTDAGGTAQGVDITIYKRCLKELPPHRQGVAKAIAQGAL
eukprot:8192060-Alexandrium_andersonii.AAC.1